MAESATSFSQALDANARHFPAGSCILRHRHQHAQNHVFRCGIDHAQRNPVVLDAARGSWGHLLHRVGQGGIERRQRCSVARA